MTVKRNIIAMELMRLASHATILAKLVLHQLLVLIANQLITEKQQLMPSQENAIVQMDIMIMVTVNHALLALINVNLAQVRLPVIIVQLLQVLDSYLETHVFVI